MNMLGLPGIKALFQTQASTPSHFARMDEAELFGLMLFQTQASVPYYLADNVPFPDGNYWLLFQAQPSFLFHVARASRIVTC